MRRAAHRTLHTLHARNVTQADGLRQTFQQPDDDAFASSGVEPDQVKLVLPGQSLDTSSGDLEDESEPSLG
jgi:hypothetical protein